MTSFHDEKSALKCSMTENYTPIPGRSGRAPIKRG